MSLSNVDSKYLKYFSTMTAAIFEPNSSARSSIRKALSEIGVKRDSVFIAKSPYEIESIINKFKPNIVITLDSFESFNGLDLVEKHLEVKPNRLNAAFVVITNYNSAVSVSEIGEHEVDFMLAKPFNQNQLIEKFLNAFNEKLNPTSYLKLLEEAKQLLFVNELEGAQEKFLHAIKANPKKSAGYYYLGIIEKKLGDTSKAIQLLERALVFENHHFKSLIALFELKFEQNKFKEALSYARRVLKDYPINPRRIGQFIRLAVATKSYKDIVYYCELSKEIAFNQTMEKFISAGLAIGAKQLIAEGENDKLASLCLEHASRYCLSFPLICLSVVDSWMKLGKIDRADSMLYKLINEEGYKTVDAYILELEVIYRQRDFPKALILALNLLKNKSYNSKVYELAIKSSIMIKRSPTFVSDLYQDAVARFPELNNLDEIVRPYVQASSS